MGASSTAALDRNGVETYSENYGPSVMMCPWMWSTKGLDLPLGSAELGVYAFIWSKTLGPENKRIGYYSGTDEDIAWYLGYTEKEVDRAIYNLTQCGLLCSAYFPETDTRYLFAEVLTDALVEDQRQGR